MRYLITCNAQPPGLTNWFDPDNHFNPEVGMIVYDLVDLRWYDGEWHELNIDHL